MRLIDADDVFRWYVETFSEKNIGERAIQPNEIRFSMNDIRDNLDNMPTIEAEPVIRCKDCDWWTKQEASLQGRCERYGIYPTGEWYCAAARLKENKKISNIETCMNCKHRVRNQYAASLPPKYKCTLLNRYVTLENRCEKFEMERGKFDEKE